MKAYVFAQSTEGCEDMSLRHTRVKSKYIAADPLSYYLHELFAQIVESSNRCLLIKTSFELNKDVAAIRSFYSSDGIGSLESIVSRHSEYETLLASAYSNIKTVESLTTTNDDQIYCKGLLEDVDHLTRKIWAFYRGMNLAHIALQAHLKLIIELLETQEKSAWFHAGHLYEIRDEYFENPDNNLLRKYLAEANPLTDGWSKEYLAICSIEEQRIQERIITREVELETFLLLES